MEKSPIGIFDSGYGGLTVLKDIVKLLPQYDFLYLGDNARAPYGTRSFNTVYEYTLECVEYLFSQDCRLVILACNTASAKALRTIQQKDLPLLGPGKRVLGVIRPTTETIGHYSHSGKIGILGTNGTVSSNSYVVETARFFPKIKVYQQACPMWVPLIENNEFDSDAANYYIRKYVDELLAQDHEIDVVLLACTHYPLLFDKIRAYLPAHIQLIAQGRIVAESLVAYLKRHPEIDENCGKQGRRRFLTTDLSETFDTAASLFYGQELHSEHLEL